MARRAALQEAVTARRDAFPGEDSWSLRLWFELPRTDGGEEEPWRCLVRAVAPGDAAVRHTHTYYLLSHFHMQV